MGSKVSGARSLVTTWVRRPVIRRVAIGLTVLVVLLAAVVLGADGWIRSRAAGREYSAADVPPADVGLVLGAEVYSDGTPSPYLAARLELGRTLLETGKVKALLLSGDHGHWSYDEPNAMRRYLMSKGVPAAELAVDYAGFDTYDSCARAYRIFGVRKAVVLTQDFSVPRTVALCRAVGIDTTAVADRSQPHDLTYRRIWLRDQLAATKAVYSIVRKPDPILGDQETTVRDAVAANGG
ncbi:SanA/YdcF family protein [Nocardia sp. alder85J]|uniref:SanA/YdcF family protein n=1 Tax=Nocardia sp. alder85J TaxID=2862949 RepID=UPI001CD33DA8|nr:ElyC/SanA/YdcF family protein [Nocardia sp. alder85J]MCX4098616.1 YdcF family protein [Nocardia sp. alder85J]